MEFGQFVEFIFDRPAGAQDWDLDGGLIDHSITPKEVVLHTKQLFCEIGFYAEKIPELQLCAGLDILINPSCGSLCYSLLDTAVPESDRVPVFIAMYDVFKVLFAGKCSNVISHGAKSPTSRYNSICYMWWHVFPRHGIPAQVNLKRTDETILQTMENILMLDSLPCQESALHGLGHWYAAYPEFVDKTIEAGRSRIRPELKTYAEMARIGDMQ